MTDSSLTRRQFTLDAALALLAGCVITVAQGCGDDSPTTPTNPTDLSGTISANHGHTATITAAQITAGAALVSMSITGQASHPHTISVSQNDLMSLRNRQAITVNSTTDDGHQHAVTFTPA